VKSIGRILFDTVVNKLQLVESDYFDLEFTDRESIPVSESIQIIWWWLQN